MINNVSGIQGSPQSQDQLLGCKITGCCHSSQLAYKAKLSYFKIKGLLSHFPIWLPDAQLTPWRNGSASDSRSEGCVFKSRRGQLTLFVRKKVKIQILQTHYSKGTLGQQPIRGSDFNSPQTPWRNGSASDSRSEGCVFKSRRGQQNFCQKGRP